MVIPDSVFINGMAFDVFTEPQSNLGNTNCGTFDPFDNVITLMERAPEQMYKTFLHECLHAMMYALGIQSDDQDEKLVDGLAYQLFMLIKDNPEMFADEGDDDAE